MKLDMSRQKPQARHSLLNEKLTLSRKLRDRVRADLESLCRAVVREDPDRAKETFTEYGFDFFTTRLKENGLDRTTKT